MSRRIILRNLQIILSVVAVKLGVIADYEQRNEKLANVTNQRNQDSRARHSFSRRGPRAMSDS
jgi:hypothetical protein